MSNKIKVLISGCSGQLLTDIRRVLDKEENNDKYIVDAFERKDWDVTDKEKNKWIFDNIKPDIYIHGASKHVIDQIEKDPFKALDVNVSSVYNISKLCNEYDTTFIHFSTNYVFRDRMRDIVNDNVCSTTAFSTYIDPTKYPQYAAPPYNHIIPPYYEKGTVYKEDPISESEKPNPCNFYGLTKAMAEKTLENDCKKWLNIRVAGLFGKTGSRSKNNTNFPYIILNKLDNLKESEKIDVVSDQIMSVGYTVDIAESLIFLLGCLISGYTASSIYINAYNTHYHLVNEGTLTWFELAQFILEVIGRNKNLINPISTDTYYSDVKRPMYSALANTFRPLFPTWQSAIIRFLREIGRI